MRRPLLLPAAMLTLLALGCGDRQPRPRNLLLVTLDTLRADRLGSYGYEAAQTPNLDRLAERGLRFSRAATVMPLTLPAHASLMTGTHPGFHGVRDNGGFYLEEESETLAEVLSAHGFRTGGFVGAFVLDSRWGIGQGFERFFDDFDLTEFDDAPGMDAIQRPGSVVVDQALAWLEAAAAEPFFAWVHLYDAHTPYQAPEPFRSRFPATRDGAYDAEIAFADAQVGRLLDALDKQGRLEDTLVAVLADHGEMLGEHDEVTHGFFLYEAAVRIPLLIAGPGIPAAEIDRQVRIVDLLPTLLARFDLAPPPDAQGVDLLPLARGEGLRLPALSESWFPRYHYGWSELTALQDGRYKYIRAPRPELYDLVADPGERDNLVEREPERAASLAAALDRLEGELSTERAHEPQPIDDETASRLQALGYLGGGSSRHLEDRPGESRGDPKDKIGLYNRLKEATGAASRDDLETALARVRQALAEDPEIVEAHLLLGNFERKSERPEAAVAAYREALALDPEHREALYSLALAYKETDRLDEAATGFERAAELDPRNGKVVWQLADVRLRQGHLDEAESRLLAALEQDLDRPRFLLKLAECHLEQKRPADAESRLRQALADNPELATAHYHLGLALEEQGRPREAAAAYSRELELRPEAYRAAFNHGRLLARAGRPGEAAEQFRKSVEARPEFGTGHLYLAKALLDLGDLEGARKAARLGLDSSPERDIAPLGHYVLADIYNRQGRPRDAAREVAAAHRLERAAAGP